MRLSVAAASGGRAACWAVIVPAQGRSESSKTKEVFSADVDVDLGWAFMEFNGSVLCFDYVKSVMLGLADLEIANRVWRFDVLKIMEFLLYEN
jgi:hypothetical protein